MPLGTERVELKLAGERLARKLAHWQQVSISACEQCGRSRLVNILQPQSLMAWISDSGAQPNSGSHAGMLMHAEGESFSSFAKPFASPEQATVLVGPEGGFTEAEIAFGRDSGFGIVKLGRRILRNETAPVVGLTLLQSRWGDFREL
ncbi:MAG: 16S rRNA (uracil(1498)-N(3))-methyltransferase [Pseudomonadales bacterium]|nr:16S rRNA (uracil(1498)-N(3))-methyltransferase [Pseudomonadales bacterium]